MGQSTNTYVRSDQRLAVTCAALILGPIFMVGPAALGFACAIGTGFNSLSLLVLPCLVAASAFITYHMLENYQWVELDGEFIRGRRFWTRQFVERRVDEISEIIPLGHAVKNVTNKLAAMFLGSVLGYKICFKEGGPTIELVRYDMTNVDALIAELIALTAKRRETGAGPLK